jgi:carboxyl-terminal processing protease
LASSAVLRRAVDEGERLESARVWVDAIRHYQEALDAFPEDRRLQHGLRRSKIHFGIERRYEDASFRTRMLRLSRHESLELFDETLNKVHRYYVDPISSTSFVAHGTESLYLALANDKFVERNLRGADTDRIREMRRILREDYWNKPVANRTAARQEVSRMCDLAGRVVGLSSSVVVMEYLFGGCNALDDYSAFLTPDRLEDLNDNIDGEFVGLGVEMKSEMGKGLLMVNVLAESPAAEAGIATGDHIVSIDGMDCRYMSTDAAAGMLRGPVQSRVRLEVESAESKQVRTTTLTRRPVQVKSIPIALMLDRRTGIAYLKMTGFQRTTADELDSALERLHRAGMRALIWDVRGNPGGLLNTAVEVLDRFIDNGVLVSTRGRSGDQNWTYSAQRRSTMREPLVLLTDENSASASEIVAGAIRDHHRGTIVGRTTYGKWSVQSIFPVESSTGLRVTTAKFYSPAGRTLGKVGQRPDVEVDLPEDDGGTLRHPRTAKELREDRDVLKALDILRRQTGQR